MSSEDFPRLVFNKVFHDDIERLRSMDDMWKSRKPPEPLDFDKLSDEGKDVSSGIAQQDQTVWTLAENVAVFKASLETLSKQMQELKSKVEADAAPPVLTFDKDDKDTLDFVAASANLRSHIFGIDMKSEFDIKRMYSIHFPQHR